MADENLSTNLFCYAWPFVLLIVPVGLWWGFKVLSWIVGFGPHRPPKKDELDKQILSGKRNAVPILHRIANRFDAWAGMFRRISYQWFVLSVVWLPLWFVIGFGLDTLGYGGGIYIAFVLPLLLFLLIQFFGMRRAA